MIISAKDEYSKAAVFPSNCSFHQSVSYLQGDLGKHMKFTCIPELINDPARYFQRLHAEMTRVSYSSVGSKTEIQEIYINQPNLRIVKNLLDLCH